MTFLCGCGSSSSVLSMDDMVNSPREDEDSKECIGEETIGKPIVSEEEFEFKKFKYQESQEKCLALNNLEEEDQKIQAKLKMKSHTEIFLLHVDGFRLSKAAFDYIAKRELPERYDPIILKTHYY